MNGKRGTRNEERVASSEEGRSPHADGRSADPVVAERKPIILNRRISNAECPMSKLEAIKLLLIFSPSELRHSAVRKEPSLISELVRPGGSTHLYSPFLAPRSSLLPKPLQLHDSPSGDVRAF